MNQLKIKSPQAFQIVNQARNNNSNPLDLFKQITKDYTPEQMDNLFNRAKQMGVPEEALNQLQNSGINTK